jgi:hypothetical protein
MGACTTPGNLMIVTELMRSDLERLLQDEGTITISTIILPIIMYNIKSVCLSLNFEILIFFTVVRCAVDAVHAHQDGQRNCIRHELVAPEQASYHPPRPQAQQYFSRREFERQSE